MSINNKRSYTEYTVTQPTTDFAIGFDDFDEGSKDVILVTLNGVPVESLGYAAIRKNENTVTITPAITEGVVRLTRETDIDEPFHKFTAGALFSAKSMDENFQQVRHSQQEVRDGFVFLENNTSGVVEAARTATARANAAAEAAEDALVDVVPASGVYYPDGSTQVDKNMEQPSITEFGTLEEAVSYVGSTGNRVRGLHQTLAVTEVPNLDNFKDIEFAKPVLGGDLNYATEDYRKIRKSKISNTIDYTAWTQDKCFEYNGTIYAPYQMSTQHTSVGQRIVWSRSFDKGNTWTQPEVILDAAINPLRGYNCFSMGESGGRLYAMMEWRTDSSSDDTEFYLYSRPLDRTRKMLGNIKKAAGDVFLNVHMENHGLIAGDYVNFSGSGVSGVSGKLMVASVSDKDNYKLATSIPVNTVVDNSGTTWYTSVEFQSNSWATQLVTANMLIGTGTSKITHIHSFADVDGDSFLMGFGFGGSTSDPTRQVGYFHIQNIHGVSATLTKYRIKTSDEEFSTEPCVIYDKAENRVYLSTRNQSGNSYSCVTRAILNSGDWETIQLPLKSVYCNMPIIKRDNKLYIFGTERGNNTFIEGGTDYLAKGVQEAATYLYEVTDFNSENIKVSVLTTDYLGGDSSNSALGVGSAIYAFGKLMYFYGAESSDSQHLYGSNSSAYDNRSRFNNNGFQPDIMLLEITLEQYVSVQDFNATGYDGKTLPIVRGTDNIRTIDAPVKFNYSTTFANTSEFKAAITGSLLFSNSGTTFIGNDTAIGFDTKVTALCASSVLDYGRGASVYLYGANHPSTPNRAIISASSDVLIRSNVLSPYGNNSTALGTAGVRFTTGYLKNLNLGNLAVFADNTTATAGGLVVGDVYRTSTGQLMIRY